MSKSDKDLESRTVANSPLQQSSFVFFPEEKTIREQLLKEPERTLQAAETALAAQIQKLEKRKTVFADCCWAAAKTAEELSAAAKSFAQTLPQSVFGVGNGEAFLLPLDRLFERVRFAEAELDRLILKLDFLLQPDRFDPSRFSFLESVLPQANIANRAEETGKNGEALFALAKELFRRIESFLTTVIEPFAAQAAEAADLANDGKAMRFGKLCALCGELQSAAAVFILEWKEQARKIGAI